MNRFLSAVVVFSMIGCTASDDATGPSDGGTLQTEDLVVGTGAVAVSGDTLTVNYIGSLANGSVFESSYALGRPYTFRLGAGQVIAGWDQGIPGMRVAASAASPSRPTWPMAAAGRAPSRPTRPIRFDVELMAIAGK